MKAIQVVEPGKIEMIEIDNPEIKTKRDVLVKIRAFGICGSDVGILRGKNPFATYPRILGHEVSGEVVDIGSQVEDLKIGDKVVLEPIEYCGHCYGCTHQHHNVCKDLEVYGVHRDGGFCEYLVADQSKWHKVDDSLSFVQACVAEPYTIAEQSTSKAKIEKGDWVLITGAGPMGLLACDIATGKGGRCIISEINPFRLEMAKKFGAEITINPLKENLGDRIQEITEGEGVNVLLETTGVDMVLKEAVDYLSPASRFVPLAFSGSDIPISCKILNQKEIVISGTRLQYEKFPVVLSYLKDKKDLLDTFITHVFKGEEFDKAFETFTNPQSNSLKVVLTFDE
ncbi:MAG: alcohol dehydrogenase catalytic domain-containing protein [Tissierellia bacterium]|nr:alcohol dehydrogenase catalytic domain-containing protein [Tissierellia bacterium]